MTSKFSFLLCICFLRAVEPDPFLEPNSTPPIFLITLSRHGDRSPLYQIPDDPFRIHWTQGYGQLTEHGAEQHISLGKFLRRFYPSLFSKNYHPDEASFFSSAADRTLMSANSFVQGLYESGWAAPSSPPVYSIPKVADHLLQMTRDCPNFFTFLQEVMSSKDVEIEDQKFSTTLEQFEQRFPVMFPMNPSPADRLRAGWKICDAVNAWNLHRFPRPQWVTTEMITACQKMLGFKFNIRFSSPKLTRFRGGPLVAHILQLLRTRANFYFSRLTGENINVQSLPLLLPNVDTELVRPNQRLIAYFAHDSTLAALMSHLGIFNRLLPPSASCLIIELHYKRTRAENFFVRFRFRNDTGPSDTRLYSLWPPVCGPLDLALESNYLCSLTQLESAIAGTYAVDVDAECGTDVHATLSGYLSTECYYPQLGLLIFIQFFVLGYLLKRSCVPMFRRYPR